MDKYRAQRLKATGVSPLKDRSECLSDALTNAVTPPLKSPVADSLLNPTSIDLHLLSQSYISLKINSDDLSREQYDWPAEEGELELFDPTFGKTRQAISIAESLRPGRWSLPKLKWCAFCKGEFSTAVDYVPVPKTFLASLGIFLAGGVCGCFMAPYYINKCKKPILLCSRCKRPV
mmetsp:Transcript_13414/g.25244  ORF Transcript_13414/g.25244 Transcript_13414/m.25244 type:complete len:176 (+) Transcript_13414:4885-5412(+)